MLGHLPVEGCVQAGCRTQWCLNTLATTTLSCPIVHRTPVHKKTSTSRNPLDGPRFSLQQKYKEQFEKTKGKMIGLKGLEDDLNLSHSVQSGKLQSDVSPLSF